MTLLGGTSRRLPIDASAIVALNHGMLRIAIACSLILFGRMAVAQPSIAPGTRVRVSIVPMSGSAAATPESHAGTFVSSTAAAVVIDTGSPASPTSFAIGTIRQIDVSRGRSNRKWTGVVLGGLLSGGAFVALACGFSNGSCNVGDNVGGFIAYYAVGAIPGAIVGGAIGSRHRGAERWQRVWGSP